MDDDGTVVDRGPRGSGSLVVSLDALKQRNRDIPVEVQQQRTGEQHANHDGHAPS